VVLREVARIAVGLGLVLGTTALVLRALDSVPRLVHRQRPGVRVLPSIEVLERETGHRVKLPSYFPDTLGWPPARVRLHTRRPVSADITFLERNTKDPSLIIYYELRSGEGIAPVLFFPAVELHAARVQVDGAEADLRRLGAERGGVWHEIELPREQSMTMRYRGALEELLLMAGSVEARTR
jgi:hypothetical protein